MQDAFLKIWERWAQVSEMDDPVGYLYRTAMNLFRKRYRRAVLRSAGRSASRPRRTTSRGRRTGDRAARALDAPAASTCGPRVDRDAGFSAKEAGRALGVRPRRSDPSRNRAGSPSAKRWGLTMPNVRELLERERHTVELEGDHFGRLIRRRDRKQRNRRVGALLVAAVLAIATIVGVTNALERRDTKVPVTRPFPERQDRVRGARPGMRPASSR